MTFISLITVGLIKEHVTSYVSIIYSFFFFFFFNFFAGNVFWNFMCNLDLQKQFEAHGKHSKGCQEEVGDDCQKLLTFWSLEGMNLPMRYVLNDLSYSS